MKQQRNIMELVDVYVQVVAEQFHVTEDRIRVYAARHMSMTGVSLNQALDFLMLLQRTSGLPPEVTVWVLDMMEERFNAQDTKGNVDAQD